MKVRLIWARVLVGIAVAGMLLGAIDPLEGSFVILPSVGLATAGAWLGHSRWRRLAAWSCALVAFGVAAMIVLSMLGGIGGNSAMSIWWGLLILPYPVGWMTGLASAALMIAENCRCQRQPKQAAR